MGAKVFLFNLDEKAQKRLGNDSNTEDCIYELKRIRVQITKVFNRFIFQCGVDKKDYFISKRNMIKVIDTVWKNLQNANPFCRLSKSHA